MFIEAYLDSLKEKLEQADAQTFEYALVGSAMLWLRGLRTHINDIDLFVTDNLYERLLSLGWKEVYPRVGDPPMLELNIGQIKVNAWYEWEKRHPIDVQETIKTAEMITDWPCQRIEELYRWKVDHELAGDGNAKHQSDIKAMRYAMITL